MDERTDLEEYVDLARVPLDPIHDAVGKLVERCHGVESGLFLAASRLTPGLTYTAAEHTQRTAGCAALLRRLAPRLDPEERDLLLGSLAVAERALEVRRSILHGTWVASEDGLQGDAQRLTFPSGVEGGADARTVTFSRESLLTEALEASRAGHTLLHGAQRWPAQLGLAPEPGPAAPSLSER